MSTNINKFNDLYYGEGSRNDIDVFNHINNVVPIPDSATIAKAIQESLINLINLAGNLGSGFIRIIFVLVVSLIHQFLSF